MSLRELSAKATGPPVAAAVAVEAVAVTVAKPALAPSSGEEHPASTAANPALNIPACTARLIILPPILLA